MTRRGIFGSFLIASFQSFHLDPPMIFLNSFPGIEGGPIFSCRNIKEIP